MRLSDSNEMSSSDKIQLMNAALVPFTPELPQYATRFAYEWRDRDSMHIGEISQEAQRKTVRNASKRVLVNLGKL